MVNSLSSPPGSSVWRHVYAGTSLAVTILLCTFAGIWADKHWGFSPWGTLSGAVIGFGAGFYNFLQEFKSDSTGSGKGD